MTDVLSQEDAARIMFAAEKWANFAEARGLDRGNYATDGRLSLRTLAAAKQAFADLIATLTESEGL